MGLMTILTTVAGIAGALITIITFFSLLFKYPREFIKKQFTKMLNSSELKTSIDSIKVEQDAHLNILKDIQVMNTKQNEVIAGLKETQDYVLEQQKLVIQVDQNMLRNALNNIYYEYHPKGYLPLYVRENLCNMHEDYKATKGNSYYESLYNELMALPPEKPCNVASQA